MQFDPRRFTVFDITAFPIITMRNEAIAPGYTVQWEAELNALTAQPQPFVLLFPAGRPEQEGQEDGKRRMIWFKANRRRLTSVCKGLISVEPDEGERRQAHARAGELAAFFGLPVETTSTIDEAQALAWRHLGEVAGRT
ncbi:hypothetical protein [Roseateles flavus]|uniref:GntR family transcriptional regulator n=1 Tax=Roseateles flavus TaxID=3149041 RepID=A0ABV0GKI5_9BURK